MTRVQPGGPSGQQDDSKARAFFAACLFIGAGFAGLAVAGIVLGCDYLLHGEPHERERLTAQRAQRNRDRYADALAWLENDRLDRERARQAKREWFNADPETRSAAPSGGESFGRVMGRIWNNMLVGTRRFKNGWKKGRKQAQQRRDNDEQLWWWHRPHESDGPAPQDPAEQAPRSPEPEPTTGQPPNSQQQPDSEPDVVDAEIIPDPEPDTREVVPVGQDEPRRPDESLDEYQRRLDDLAGEVQQNRNGHQPDPSQTVFR